MDATAKPEASPSPPPPSPPTTVEKIAGEEKIVMNPPSMETSFDGSTSKPHIVDDILNNLQPKKCSPKNSPGKIAIGSNDRELAFARLQIEKMEALINAWQVSQTTKVKNKAQKKMSTISTWENSKTASIEAGIRKMEEAFEKKKAESREKLMNKLASIHKRAEEKRAIIEAKKGEDMLKTEETAAKFKAFGIIPKKVLGCFENS